MLKVKNDINFEIVMIFYGIILLIIRCNIDVLFVMKLYLVLIIILEKR